MKATDDPRIIASHPAPGAGVGLRSARPFGLLAFPGGVGMIGQIGQAALSFAQRSLAAPLRYQQPELTWLDSFRLGRRPPAHIQPWRRRPAAPAPQTQLGASAPDMPAGADDWAAATPLSPLTLIQPPASTPSLARLARAITAAPARSPALSLRRSPGPDATQPPGQPADGGMAEVQAWQPAGDHSLARALFASRAAHPGLARSSAEPGRADSGQAPDLSGSPLALIQPLRAGQSERADPRSAITRSVQRPGRPADQAPARDSRPDTQANPERADPRSTIARSALPLHQAAGPLSDRSGRPPAETNAAAPPQPAVSPAGPSARTAETAHQTGPGSTSPILLPDPAGSGPAAQRALQPRLPLLERYRSVSGTGQDPSRAAERPLVATPTLVRRLLSGVAADGAVSPGAASSPALPLPGPEPAASSGHAQSAFPTPNVIGRAWAGDLPEQPPAASADPGNATRAGATWLQPLRALPALMRSRQVQPAISRSGRPDGGPRPAGESSAGGWGQGQGGGPDRDSASAGLIRRSAALDPVADAGRQPLDNLARFGSDEHPATPWGGAAGQAATPAAMGDPAPASFRWMERGAPAAHVGPALVLRQPLGSWLAGSAGSADATSAGRVRPGFISRLAGSWLAGNEPAEQRAGAGSAGAGRQAGPALPLIAALQRSGSGVAITTAPFRADWPDQPAPARARANAALTAAIPPAESDRQPGWMSRMAAAGAGERAALARQMAQGTPLPLVARRPLAGRPAEPGLMRRIDGARGPAGRAVQPQASDGAPRGWQAPVGQPDGPKRAESWLSRSAQQSQATAAPPPGTDVAAATSPNQADVSSALSATQSAQATRSIARAATSQLAHEWLASTPPTPAGHGQRRALEAGPLLARSIAHRQNALQPSAVQRSGQPAFEAGQPRTLPEPTSQPGPAGSAWLTPLQRRWSGGRTGAAGVPESASSRLSRPAGAGPSGMPWPLSIQLAPPATVQEIRRSSAGPAALPPLPLLRTASAPAQQDQTLRPTSAATARPTQASRIPGAPASPEHGSIWRAAQSPWPAAQPAQAASAAWAVPPGLSAGAPSAARPPSAPDSETGQERGPLGLAHALPLIQPARLAASIWQRAAVEQRESATPSDLPAAGIRAAGMAQLWSTAGQPSAAPLALVQPARLGSSAWQRALAEQRESATQSDMPAAGGRPTAIAPRLSAGQPSAAPLALVQPARLAANIWQPATAEQRESATPSHPPAAGNRAAGVAPTWLSAARPSAAPLSLIQPERTGGGVGLAGGMAPPWLSAARPSAAPLALIQPARLTGASWRRSAVEQREIATPSEPPAGNRAAAMAQPWLSVGQPSAAPLALIQPARLGSGADPADRLAPPWAAGRASAAPLSPVQPARLAASMWQGPADEQRDAAAASYSAAGRASWTAGRPSATPLIQPARLSGELGQRTAAGLSATPTAHQAFARPEMLQRLAGSAALEFDGGSALALMAPLARPAATADSPGSAAQTLASGLIHRFRADSGDTGGRADSPAAASALELLRPAGLEHEQPGGSEGEARNVYPAAQAPSLDLIQPMREASPPALQRALEDAENGAQGGAAAAADGGAPAADIESLARQVYARLRRRLKIDAERLGN